MLQPAGKMVATAKAAVPTISDQAAAMQLGNFAKATASAIHELRTAVRRASEACGSLEIDSALDVIKGLGRVRVYLFVYLFVYLHLFLGSRGSAEDRSSWEATPVARGIS